MKTVPSYYLNGQLVDRYDPYLNRLVTDDASAVGRFVVPLLFTQSGTKPMTSVEMSNRYTDFYQGIRESDAIVVVGYGFNGDDGHINGVLRYAADIDGKRVVVLSYNDLGSDDAVFESYFRKLRLKRNDLLTVLRLDDRRRIENRPWVDALVDSF